MSHFRLQNSLIFFIFIYKDVLSCLADFYPRYIALLPIAIVVTQKDMIPFSFYCGGFC